MKNDDIQTVIPVVVRAYLEAAMFTDSGHDEGNVPPHSEFSSYGVLQAYATVADFLKQCDEVGLLDAYVETGRTWDAFGHDVWLTRNRHGTGFWDRGMGELGDKLTALANLLGTAYVVETDDLLVCFEG
jgi:hypothetical protein